MTQLITESTRYIPNALKSINLIFNEANLFGKSLGMAVFVIFYPSERPLTQQRNMYIKHSIAMRLDDADHL